MQNNFFLKSFICILLIGQLWVAISSTFFVLLDTDSDNIELSISDNETEDDKKEKKKDKITYSFQFFFAKVDFIEIKNNFNKVNNFTSSNYIEINLPPPEYYCFS